MWAIVGLGNPGTKYTLTRHNAGFLALDQLARGLGIELNKSDHKAQMLKCSIEDQDVVFVKPQTYMNLSGQSVVSVMQFYKIEPSNLLVVHDEVDLPFGRMKLQKNRGSGGHNGIKSVSELLGTQDYLRLRVGVGRPSNTHVPVVDYVLQNFSDQEQKLLPEFLNLAADAIEAVIFEGYDKAVNRVNSDDWALII